MELWAPAAAGPEGTVHLSPFITLSGFRSPSTSRPGLHVTLMRSDLCPCGGLNCCHVCQARECCFTHLLESPGTEKMPRERPESKYPSHCPDFP